MELTLVWTQLRVPWFNSVHPCSRISSTCSLRRVAMKTKKKKKPLVIIPHLHPFIRLHFCFVLCWFFLHRENGQLLTCIWTMLSVMIPPISAIMQITEAPKNCNPNEIFQLNFIHSNLALELNDVGRWTINVGFVCNAPAAVNAWLTYRRFIFLLLDSQVCPLSCLFRYWFMPNALLFHYSLAHLPAPLRCSPISFTCSHSRNVLIVSR